MRAETLLVWLGVFVVVCVVITRIVVGGQDALARGDTAMEKGQTEVAVMAWRTSLGWYLPGASPWRAEAADRLNGLVAVQIERGDVAAAVASLTALRAGRHASRAFGGPGSAADDHRLARLLARWEAEAAAKEGRKRPDALLADRVAFFEARLAADGLPRPVYGLAVVFGFFLWIGGFAFAMRRPEAREWRWAMLSSVIGFIVFVIGLMGA